MQAGGAQRSSSRRSARGKKRWHGQATPWANNPPLIEQRPADPRRRLVACHAPKKNCTCFAMAHQLTEAPSTRTSLGMTRTSPEAGRSLRDAYSPPSTRGRCALARRGGPRWRAEAPRPVRTQTRTGGLRRLVALWARPTAGKLRKAGARQGPAISTVNRAPLLGSRPPLFELSGVSKKKHKKKQMIARTPPRNGEPG